MGVGHLGSSPPEGVLKVKFVTTRCVRKNRTRRDPSLTVYPDNVPTI